jgi:hypothetical protein
VFRILREDLISKKYKIDIMKIKNALIPLCLLASIVTFSGCIGQGGGGGGTGTNGIIIKDFGFAIPSIYTGETADLTLTLQNVGGEKGTLQEIAIFGVDKGDNPGALTWGEGSGDDFEQTFTATDTLVPPDPTTGFEGDEHFAEYMPESPTGIKSPTTYDFQARVKYLYTTTFTGKITVVKDEYLRSLPADQRDALIKVGGVQDSSVSGGPLSLAAASGRHFIMRSDDTLTARPIKFKITNVGSGFPYITPWGETTLYYITVSASDGISCNVGTDDANIKLSRGKTGIIPCTFTPPAYGTYTNKLDKMFSVTLNYGYYVDSSASITVNPVYE